MELHNLQPADGSVKRGKRIARGQGSGKGGTATRGHKGAKSRSGYSRKIGFEGGQMPIQRRLPKRGFKNRNRVEYRALNLDHLQAIVDQHGLTAITFEGLLEKGLVHKNDRIKILGRGALNGKLDVAAHAFSASAKKAIEDLGGNATEI
jgi:large subunit ribosomal protein L15